MTDVEECSTCNTVRWLVFPQMEGPEHYEEWIRTAGLADDGTVFVTAAFAAGEELVYMFAHEDNVKTVTHHGHLYAPAWWLAEQFPSTEELCALISERVRRHFFNKPHVVTP